jgi:glycogen operon protein
MEQADWQSPKRAAICVFLNGEEIGRDGDGKPIADDDFLILLNGGHDAVTFLLPDTRYGARWRMAAGSYDLADRVFTAGSAVELPGHAFVLLSSKSVS